MKKLIIAFVLLLTPFFASASIDKNLSYGLKNDSDVMELQEFLTNDGCYNGLTRGNFLMLTLKGVKCFQTKYHDEISALAGYSIKSSGFVGSGTRAFINQKLEEELADSNAEANQEGTTACTPYWKCSDWSTCTSSQQTRSCTDSNSCRVTTGKPSETQGCTATCTPSWQCTSWSTCVNSQQARACADSNSCGVATGEPIETRVCANACIPNWQCSSWSSCTNSQQTRTCPDTNSCGVLTGKPVESQPCTCAPNWQCTNWSQCSNSQQTRTCADTSICGLLTGKPNETLSCNLSSILQDGFDAYTNGSIIGQGGWYEYKSGSNFIVQGTTSIESAKALYINTRADSVINKAGIPLSDGRQAVYIRTENRVNWGEYLDGNAQVRVSKGIWSPCDNFVGVTFKKDGNVSFYNGSDNTYTNFSTYNDNEWTLLEIEWRSIDKSARYRINSGAWTGWYPFWSTNTFTDFDNVGFDFDNRNGSTGSGGVYFDMLY